VIDVEEMEQKTLHHSPSPSQRKHRSIPIRTGLLRRTQGFAGFGLAMGMFPLQWLPAPQRSVGEASKNHRFFDANSGGKQKNIAHQQHRV